MFAVTTARGPAWDASVGIREQVGWDAHAAFAEGLVDRGVIVLGGPVDGAPEEVALVLVDADTEDEARAAFDPDPWIVDGVIRLAHVRHWRLWLDGRSR